VQRGWVVFDLDGTLIESEQIWAEIRRDFVAEHGGRWNDGAQAAMMGMRTVEWARYMHDDLGVALPADSIAQRVVDAVAERLAVDLPVIPGARRVLEEAAGAFVLGVATSSAQQVAATVLARTGWAKFFSVVVSADSVARGKPAPDVYLRALDLLAADPTCSAAVEDSGNGIRSAYAAGLAVIGIPNHAYPPDPAALALADRRVAKLEDLDPGVIRDVLLRRATERRNEQSR
jgi:HAD superfamily hydrolase (TIGR01509 family)